MNYGGIHLKIRFAFIVEIKRLHKITCNNQKILPFLRPLSTWRKEIVPTNATNINLHIVSKNVQL